ncbi:hypothetical protein CFB81_09705 [Burkholderia sp. AU28863]|nr:hypothetical protein CFB81_09705 [Burkholderia sp. AU28863]
MRVHAQPRPAGCRRVPSAPPKNKKARLVRVFLFASFVAPACGRVTAEWTKPPRGFRIPVPFAHSICLLFSRPTPYVVISVVLSNFPVTHARFLP